MSKTIKLMAMLVFTVTMTIGLSSCETSTKNSQKETKAEIQDVKDFTTVEGTKRSIEGTVWTYAEPLKGFGKPRHENWVKLEFRNGKVYEYLADPNDGDWGKPQINSYSVEEKRSGSTGEKYVYIAIDREDAGGHCNFIPNNPVSQHAEYWRYSFQVYSPMIQRDYTWK